MGGGRRPLPRRRTRTFTLIRGKCSMQIPPSLPPDLSYPILSYPILSYPILSYPILGRLQYNALRLAERAQVAVLLVLALAPAVKPEYIHRGYSSICRGTLN